MTKLFIEVLNCSFAAAAAGGIVLLCRLLLQKLPRRYSYLLWSVVLIRALCPFSLESVFSLMPVRSRPIKQDIVYQAVPRIDTGISVANDAANRVLQTVTPEPVAGAGVNPIQVLFVVLAALWCVGAVLMAVWSGVSYWRLKRKLRTAVLLEANVWESGSIGTALVMGLLHPKIYLPAGLSDGEREVILAHERVHLARKDHWIKLLAFAALCIHWFNPVLWLCWHFARKDMEMSCDETVLRKMEGDRRKQYSMTLLHLSERQSGLFSPLAFGESGVKSRIQNVLRYRKPVRWMLVAGAGIAVLLTVGLLLSRPADEQTLADLDVSFDFSQNHYSRLWMWEEGNILSRQNEEMELLADFGRSVRLYEEPVDQSRSEDRMSAYQFHACWETDGTEYSVSANFTEDFAEVWVDNGVKPTFTYRVANPDELQKRWDHIWGNEEGTEGVRYTMYYGGKSSGTIEYVDWSSASWVTELLLSGESEGEPVERDYPDVFQYLQIEIGTDKVYFVYQEGTSYWVEHQNDYRRQLPSESYTTLMRSGTPQLTRIAGDYTVVLQPYDTVEWTQTQFNGTMTICLQKEGHGQLGKTVDTLNVDARRTFEAGDLTGEGEVEVAVPVEGGNFALYRLEGEELVSMGYYQSLNPAVPAEYTVPEVTELELPMTMGVLEVGSYRVELLLRKGVLVTDAAPGGGTYSENYQGEYLLRLTENGELLSELVLGERNFPGKFTIRSTDYDGNPQTPEFAIGQWSGSSQMSYDIFSIRDEELISLGIIISSEFQGDFSPLFLSRDGRIFTDVYSQQDGVIFAYTWEWNEQKGFSAPLIP